MVICLNMSIQMSTHEMCVENLQMKQTSFNFIFNRWHRNSDKMLAASAAAAAVFAAESQQS